MFCSGFHSVVHMVEIGTRRDHVVSFHSFRKRFLHFGRTTTFCLSTHSTWREVGLVAKFRHQCEYQLHRGNWIVSAEQGRVQELERQWNKCEIRGRLNWNLVEESKGHDKNLRCYPCLNTAGERWNKSRWCTSRQNCGYWSKGKLSARTSFGKIIFVIEWPGRIEI
jgi:hypothetical protein